MAAETMPERIWAEPVHATSVLVNRGVGIWDQRPVKVATDYIRADLCVLASTHQRVIEALVEAVKAAEDHVAAVDEFQRFEREEPTNSTKQWDTRFEAKEATFDALRSALATIKETAP